MTHHVLIAPSRSGHTWAAGMLRSWLPDDKVHDFEGIPPKIYNQRVRQNVWYGGPPDPDQPVVAILLLRDLLNFAASWIKYLDGGGHGSIDAGIDTWYAISREAFGDTRFIQDPKHLLIYDCMVQSETYRRAACSQLDGSYCEDQIDLVPPGSPGSSFDKFTYQGAGSQMQVLERWKWFLTNEGKPYIPHLREREQVVRYYAGRFRLTKGQKELVRYILM